MTIKHWALATAYLTVGAGMFIFHNAWAALLGYHAGMVLILLMARPALPVATLFKAKGLWLALRVILLCGGSGAALYFLWPIFDIIPNLAADLAAIELTSTTWPVFIAYFTLVNPWLEEYFWRGYLGSTSKQLTAADFFFAGFHALVLFGRTSLLSIAIALCALTFVSWLWRQVMRRSDGMLINVLAHMAADFTILYAVYRMCQPS